MIREDVSGIDFTYDAAGNRISKRVKNAAEDLTTYYVRDASGNVMSIYEKDAAGFWLTEQPIYGSDRLGMRSTMINLTEESSLTTIDHSFGQKQYELKNHLGNILAVVSDRKDQNGNAVVLSANDYYPFGMNMPGRTASGSGYRYGFNGKEKDSEGLGGGGSTYDYGFRIYNPSIAKFLSVDPLTKDYPWYTPYQYAGNKPTVNLDLDGLEDYNYLNELLRQGTELLIRKASDIASNAIYNASIALVKDAKDYATKKVNETSYVQDISVTPSKKLISVGNAEVNFIATGGVAWIQNIGDNKEKEGVYPHIGIGFSVVRGQQNHLIYQQ